MVLLLIIGCPIGQWRRLIGLLFCEMCQSANLSPDNQYTIIGMGITKANNYGSFADVLQEGYQIEETSESDCGDYKKIKVEKN